MRASRIESIVVIAIAGLAALATFGPHVPPLAAYHQFADTRPAFAIANAADVLSNIAFLIAGLLGAWALHRLPHRSLSNMQRAMTALFFAGLVITSACSAWYHLRPDDVRLVADRSGMAIAFSGLLGLAVADRVSERASALVGLLVLLCAPWAIGQAAHGELLPWATLQFGGMALLLVLAVQAPRAHALQVNWLALIAIYAAAKVCEMHDAAIFTATGALLSGHTLKHLLAACAAWPVIVALRWHNEPSRCAAVRRHPMNAMRRIPR